ncbi:MAG: EVE domain-containing protein [Alphaproteobacteria bacterium]|nr:EVE domain-containing protein [Alphaproteobacteria bacterium]MBM3952212.1 EVE domain-containing protein [Rhodospirillales bacterium]
MAYWLVKSEPETWSWNDHVKKGVEPWNGVRNFQAAANLKAMKKGDRAFFYHSGESREIVGIVEVVKTYYPDPSDETGRFGMVDFRARQPLKKPVTLAAIKAEPRLAHLALVRQSRLSVMPIDDQAWARICRMGGIEP